MPVSIVFYKQEKAKFLNVWRMHLMSHTQMSEMLLRTVSGSVQGNVLSCICYKFRGGCIPGSDRLLET